MTPVQKAVKYLAIALAVFLIFGIISGIMSAVGAIFGVFQTDGVTDELTVYEVSEQVTELEIEVNAANFTIKTADRFSVESNLKYLTVEEKDGTLVIKDRKKNGVRFDNPVLTLYVPKETVFEYVTITTGAGKLQIDLLSTNELQLTLGAGEVKIDKLCAQQSATIEGGTGAITIRDGSLTDLELQMGVGQLDMTAALYGDSFMQLGVGQTDLTVLCAKEQYSIEIEKGLGSITVDRTSVDGDYHFGDGEDRLEIEGGIGSINLKFAPTEE